MNFLVGDLDFIVNLKEEIVISKLCCWVKSDYKVEKDDEFLFFGG